MPLSPGDKLGPFEILAPLGAGGMGEVYKARDSRLDRLVAVKISWQEFSERFEREARAIAQLNHPRICHLYDVGPNYLVMELVEGSPLKGPLPVAKAVDYAGQILDALDAAHRKGITHRDLKPANILVTKQGIKLLDFGLAKFATTAPKDSEETLTQALTHDGHIVGTLQYMSPEQLQGKDVDARSDLFGFGCVLYEMLSGKRAFEADSQASVIAAILEREPAPLSVAAPLDRLIRKCLAKVPDERFQTARDLKYNLALALEQRPPAAKPGRRWWIAGITGLAVGAMLTLLLAQPREEDPLAGVRFTPLAVDSYSQSLAAFSPDGKSVAYRSFGGKIWVRQLDRDVPSELTADATGTGPFWSPDPRFVYYRRNAGGGREIWRVSVVGGAPEFVVRGGLGGLFTPDGKSLLVWDGKVRASSPPGTPLKDPQNPASFPAGIVPLAFAPDGSKWLGDNRSTNKSWIVSYPGGKARELPAGLQPVAWFPDSRHLLLTLYGDLNQGGGVAFWDSESLQTSTIFRVPLATFPALSPDGKRIALAMGSVNWDIQEFSLDGKWLRDLVATSLFEGDPEWSPAGDRLAYVSEELGSRDVWVRDDKGRQRAPILKRQGGRLRFSPDGRRVAVLSDHIEVVGESGGNSITVAAKGSEVGFGYIGGCWSPDGRSIAFARVSMGSASEVGIVDANGAAQPATIAKGDSQKYAGPCRWTPDGQYLFIAGSQLLRISLADKSERVVPAQAIGAGSNRDFSTDASRLYAVEQDESGRWRLMQIDTATGKTVASSALDINPPARVFSISPHPDGKRVALMTGGPRYDLWTIEGYPLPSAPGLLGTWSRRLRQPIGGAAPPPVKN